MTTLIPETRHGLLEANLAALARRSPGAAARVRAAQDRHGLAWSDTDESGHPSATLDGRWLASRRRPGEEAAALAATVDPARAGAAVVLGFGLGYHVEALAKRLGRDGALFVFEPDAELLRAVLSRLDCSWLNDSTVVVLTDPDAPELTRATQGFEPLLALGAAFVEHTPSRARLGALSARFAEAFTRVIGSLRTHVITTMVQMGVTVRNLLMNCDHYACGAGVADLENAAPGAPAIVVSAGPSLKRNIELLKTPGLRERCVIIAVQTVLKQLLREGIRPHFVTALDYHEISARFYEGLTPQDVEGVTLIAEPKANPAILQAFPGQIRLVASEYLDTVLGRDLAGEHGAMKPGATVAHLAYYFARHLGCDPVILMGQDLAFTDGQYYAAGAAIHDVWASELNDFNTLELMEWQRIVRWRGHLHKLTDQLGRPIYTDDQMAAYIAQFERDFLADAERGLVVIDATEGGVAKAHTRIMPLRDAIERYASPDRQTLPPFTSGAPRRNPARLRQLSRRIDRVRRDTREVAKLSREAAAILQRMADAQQDQALTNRLIEDVQELRRRVEKLEPAYGLVHRLNQAGAFKRMRADRLLRITPDLDPFERQRRQIERDQMNVSWLADAADSLAETLQAAQDMLEGGERLTRDPAPPSDAEITGDDGAPAAPAARLTVSAVILVDAERSGLGLPRDLGATFQGKPLLRATLERLAPCRGLDGVTLLTDAPQRIRAILGKGIPGLTLRIERIDGELLRAERASRAAARLWSRACWRGGLGYATAWDEAFDARLFAGAMTMTNCDAALVVGADWALVDPELCNRVIERYREHRGQMPLAFAQAPPGLAGLVISASLTRDLAEGRAAGDHLATIGGVLGYTPTRPRTDPIASAACVLTSPIVRDAPLRLIPDDNATRAELESALRDLTALDAESIVRAVMAQRDALAPACPDRIILELHPRRALPKFDGALTRPSMARDDVLRITRDIAAFAPAVAVTLAGAGDPLLHPDFTPLVHAIRDAGVSGLHVRTDLASPDAPIDTLIGGAVGVVSVNVHAANAAAYASITGLDRFDLVMQHIDALLAARRASPGGRTPWIVPRMTRRDAVYEQIEEHVDKSLFICGAVALDQLEAPIPGERIEPLGKPRATAVRDWRSRMMILSDGSVIADERDVEARSPVANVLRDGAESAWRALMDRRMAAWRANPAHPDLWTGW